MSGSTTELNLKTAVDSDDTADYLTLSLADSLRTVDALYNNVTGHTHSGVHQGGPIASIPAGAIADGSITSVKIADGTIGTVDLANTAVTPIKLNLPTFYMSSGSDIAMTAGGYTDILSAPVTAGKWLFLAEANFFVNAGGICYARIAGTASGGLVDDEITVKAAADKGALTLMWLGSLGADTIKLTMMSVAGAWAMHQSRLVGIPLGG
jgi:hypothetical protein